MEGREGETKHMRVFTARAALLGTAAAAAFFATSANAQPNAPAPGAQQSSDKPGTNDAQTQAQAATGSDQAIFVTARRRSELLLNVPVAVSAYSGEQLNRQGALTITEVAKTTPNVTLKVSRGTNSTLTPFIRGIGQQDPVAGFEQGVGVYLDDVYFNRPQAAVLDIYDVERIEVLRGPQGTLYGRNTIGGAIKFVTKRIRDDGPHISMRTNIGTHQQADFIVSASTPITKGLLFGIAGARLSNGGYGKNRTTGLSNYNKNILAGRASLEFVPSDRIFFRVTGDYIVDDSNPKGGHRVFPNFCTVTTGTSPCAGTFPSSNNVYDTDGGLTDPTQRVRAGGIALHAEADVNDWLKVRSITAYRKDTGYTPIDFDATPFPDVDVPAIYRNKQFSQELQLVVDGPKVQGVAGLYYLNARAFDEFDVRLYTTLPSVLPGFTASTLGNVHTKTWAAFADFTYNFSEQWALSLGGRWTNDQRTAYILAQNRILGGQPGLGGSNGFGVGTVIPVTGTVTNFTGTRTDTAFTPRASINFKPTPDHNIYLSYSRGFKGGGFDPRGKASQAPVSPGATLPTYQQIYDFIAFRPETVDSYELGWKAALFDRRLQLATAIFDAEYKDVQVPGSAPCTISGVNNFCGVTTNAGAARMRGVEVEMNARVAQNIATPGDRLTLAGSLGYLDGKYKRFITTVPNPSPPPANIAVDVSAFRKIQNTPKWTMSGTLDYSTPMAGGHLDANTTVAYRGDSQQFEFAIPFLDQKAYALWDANMVWRSGSNRFELGLHAKNLTNQHYIIGGYNFFAVNPVTGSPVLNSSGLPTPALGKTGVGTAFYGDPRQVFVSATVNF